MPLKQQVLTPGCALLLQKPNLSGALRRLGWI